MTHHTVMEIEILLIQYNLKALDTELYVVLEILTCIC